MYSIIRVGHEYFYLHEYLYRSDGELGRETVCLCVCACMQDANTTCVCKAVESHTQLASRMCVLTLLKPLRALHVTDVCVRSVKEKRSARKDGERERGEMMGERHFFFSFLCRSQLSCHSVHINHFRILRTAEGGGSGYARLLFLKEGKNKTKISTYSMNSCAGEGNDETHLYTRVRAHHTHARTHAHNYT